MHRCASTNPTLRVSRAALSGFTFGRAALFVCPEGGAGFVSRRGRGVNSGSGNQTRIWIRRTEGYDSRSVSLAQQLEQPADAVITTGGGHPLDMTFYQCIKGITAAEKIVRPGGRILMVGECSEGVGSPEFSKMMERYATDEDFLRETEHAPVTVDQWQLEKLALVTQRNQVLYAIPGVPADYRSKTWRRSYADPQEAVEALCAGLKPEARIAIVPEGPYVFGAGEPGVASGKFGCNARPRRFRRRWFNSQHPDSATITSI